MKLRDFAFPLVMCLLTAATAWRYGSIVDSNKGTKVYSFLLETDRDGFSRIASGLEGSVCREVGGEEVSDGLYRLTVRCPPDKVSTVWDAIKGFRRSSE